MGTYVFFIYPCHSTPDVLPATTWFTKIINSVSFSYLFQVQPRGLNPTELDDPNIYTISIGKAADCVLLLKSTYLVDNEQ